MKCLHILISTSVLQAALAFPAIPNSKRTLDGLLSILYTNQMAETTSDTRQSSQTSASTSGSYTVPDGPLTSNGHSRTTATATVTKMFSIIDTPKDIATLTVFSSSTFTDATTATFSPPLTASATETPPSKNILSSTPRWKVAGIALIAVSVLAVASLSIIFFDSWSRFLRDALWRKKSEGRGSEDLVPDWEKRSWLSGEDDSHKYRTFSSPTSDAKDLAVERQPVDKEKERYNGLGSNLNPFPRRPRPAVNPASVPPDVMGFPLASAHPHSGQVIQKDSAYDGIETA